MNRYVTNISIPLKHPQSVVFYYDIVSNDDDRKKILKRDLKISNILDEISVDEFENKILNIGKIDLDGKDLYIHTMDLKYHSKNILTNYYKDDLDIDQMVDSFISNITNIKHPLGNFDVVSNSSNFNLPPSSVSRMVITRVTNLSNRIAASSRVGPGNFILCGFDAFDYIQDSAGFSSNIGGNASSGIVGNIMGISVFLSRSIQSNKIVITRKFDKISPGVNVVVDSNNKLCSIFECGDWWNSVYWFSIF